MRRTGAGVQRTAPSTVRSQLDANPTRYDNANPQTTGVFRDWTRNLAINRALDVGGTLHQAINFTNTATQAVDAVSLHDTLPGNGVPELYQGTAHIEADVLVHDTGPTPNMSRFIGLVAMFNQGPGRVGITLLRKDQVGVNDTLNIRIIDQAGDTSTKPNLSQRTFTSIVNDDEWYRLMMTSS